MKYFIFLFVILIITFSCKKEKDVLDLTFEEQVNNITDSSANISVYVKSNNSRTINEIGINGNNNSIQISPTTGLNVIGGIYLFNVNNLQEGMTYSFQSFAVSGDELEYGNIIDFTTIIIPEIIIPEDYVQVNSNVSFTTYDSVQFDIGFSSNLASLVINEVGVISTSFSVTPISGLNATNGNHSFSVINLAEGTTYSYTPYVLVGNDTIKGNEIEFTTVDIPSGPAGGYIFYDDGQGGGMEMAPIIFYNKPWGCEGTSVPGTSSVVGTGQANTDSILTYCPFSVSAAKSCSFYSFGGYDDWYLPSIDELELIHLNLISNFPGLVPDGLYWSSTESTLNSAKGRNIPSGVVINYAKNGTSTKTIPIRSF
jgi:hypothetical protein